MVQRSLMFAGYEVVLAETGLGGLKKAKQVRPDLILMDINLPDLSGREVTTRLRAEGFINVPIVAVTALSQAGEREKALAAGVDGYLTKPIDIDKLPQDVARFLAGDREKLSPDEMLEASAAYNAEVVSHLEDKIRELEKSNENLRHMDKIKEGFIQLTAHELRTPITLIYGYSRLIQESSSVQETLNNNPELKAYLEGLIDSVERMSSVVNEILTISRIATGHVQLSLGPNNLADIAEEVVNEWKPTAEQRSITLSFHKANWPTKTVVDGDLMQLTLNNIVSNGIKYTPDGGMVMFNARVHHDAKRVLITVQDTGIGIAQEDVDHIFERFYTAGDTQLHSTSKTAFRGGGLGLGLAIAKGIVEAHYGKIWAESPGMDAEELPGSTFFIDIPLNVREAIQASGGAHAQENSARPTLAGVK